MQLPDTIEATIVEADAVVKGQTASSSYKPAILDNGVRVMVPPHIGAGTRIVVDVYEQTYVSARTDLSLSHEAREQRGSESLPRTGHSLEREG